MTAAAGGAGSPASSERRRALALLVVGAAGPVMAACRGRATVDHRVRVPLSQVPAGRRMRIEYAGQPVEIQRTETGVVARSLMCTHFGCHVRWDRARERYLCACHGGEFDSRGLPVAGPPALPLALLPVETTDSEIVVGAP